MSPVKHRGKLLTEFESRDPWLRTQDLAKESFTFHLTVTNSTFITEFSSALTEQNTCWETMQNGRTAKICLVCRVWTVLHLHRGITNASRTLPASVQCQNNLREDIAHCMHIYLHGYIALIVLTHICLGNHSGGLQTHNMLCWAAAGVNVGVTSRVSHSILLARTGDCPRGQKWAIGSNLTPSWKSSAPASAASVIRSSCDTAAMCWGLFYAMREWNLSPAGS